MSRGGRSRSSTTTTSPSSAVSALKGLFSTGVANGLVNGSSRPRSLSASPPTSPLVSSPLTVNTTLLPTPEGFDDPKDSSFGNRASALLNLSLQRATNNLPQPSSSSLLLSQSIRDSIGPMDEQQDGDSDTTGKQRERDRLHVAYSNFDRPTSASSLPPPPRTKRLGSAGGVSPAPRTPVMEHSLQEELMKAMFAPVRDMHGRRASVDTVPEEAVSPITPLTGRTSLDGRPRASLDFADLTRMDRLVPFPVPNSAASMQFSKSSASFGPEVGRPVSALSNISNNSFHADNSSPTTSSPTASKGPSSPKRSRKVPKMLAPPSGPPPAPPPATPKGESKSLHPDDTPGSPPSQQKERISSGTSFFSSKRISTGSTGLSSIKSFATGSSSRSNSLLRSGGVHPSPRPPPSFALPPTPGSTTSSTAETSSTTDHHGARADSSYSRSIRSNNRNPAMSNSSVSPSRSIHGINIA